MTLARRVWVMVLVAVASAAMGQPTAKERPFVPANRWAMVVGASAYTPEIGPLKYSSKEAREFAALLTDRLGFRAENVRLLADGGNASEAPTAEHMLAALDELLRDPRLDKANLFVFYFSGHGVGTATGDLLLPSDVRPDRIPEMGVPVGTIIDRVVRAGLKNVLFIADACRSGEANRFGAQFFSLCKQANIAVILGCAPGMRSYEYTDLKSGAFTHFLIKAIEDPTLRDESGTLWAAALGARVGRDAHDFTEPDYGRFAQTPAVWGDGSTLDVLLATYPTSPITDVAADIFKKSAERLGAEEFAVAATDYASTLVLEGRHDRAVEILKAVDQQGNLSTEGRYCLGLALASLGRLEESDHVLKPLQDGPPGYYRDLSLIFSVSRSVPAQRRVQAAERIIEGSPSWHDKMRALAVAMQCGGFEDKRRLARRLIALTPSDRRRTLYAKGCLASIEGRWKDAVAALEGAMTAPGAEPSESEIQDDLYAPVASLGDPPALERYAKRGSHLRGLECASYIILAQLAKDRNDTSVRVDLLRKAIAAAGNPEELWTVARAAGRLVRDLKAEFGAAAKRYPYAWRAKVLYGLVTPMDEQSRDDLFESAMVRVDALTVLSQQFDLLNSIYEEAVQAGEMTELEYRHEVESFFLSLLGQTRRFEFDAGLWEEFIRFGLLNERDAQVRAVIARRLPARLETAHSSLIQTLLVTALNFGDDAAAAKIRTASTESYLRADVDWLYVLYLATRDRAQEAAALANRLGTPTTSEGKRIAEATRTYLMAKRGRVAEVRARLKSTPNDPTSQAISGLAFAAIGDWRRAEPMLARQAEVRQSGMLFLAAKALSELHTRYVKSGRTGEISRLAYAASAIPTCPLMSKVSFVRKPGLAQFAGKATMPCVIEDDLLCVRSLAEEGKKTLFSGTLTIAVSAAGAVNASFSDETGKSYPFAGKIDGLGNYRGQAKIGSRVFAVAAKLAPPSAYKGFAKLGPVWPMFELVDAEGYRVVILGRLTNLPRRRPALP